MDNFATCSGYIQKISGIQHKLQNVMGANCKEGVLHAATYLNLSGNAIAT